MTTSADDPQQPAWLGEWTPEQADRMARDHMAGGWLRALPAVGVQILGAIASRGRAVTGRELGEVLPVEPVDGARWAAPCWGDAPDPVRTSTLDQYAAHLGLGPVRTCRDVLALLVAAGALHQDGDTLYPVLPVPRVDDVFPVSHEERQNLAAMRAPFEDVGSVA